MKTGKKNWGADLVTISSHKIHGFKGTGALYVADTRMIRPILFGGEQQGEIRPGTENVAVYLRSVRRLLNVTPTNQNLYI